MLGTTAMRRYVGALAVKGIPSRLILEGSGLGVDALSMPMGGLRPDQYRTLATNLLAVSGSDGIQLAAASFRDLSDLGIVGHASAVSRTVRDTYSVWSRFGPALVGMMGRLSIVAEDHDTVTFGVASPDADDPLYRFAVEELLTMVGRVSRTPIDGHPSVRSLSFSYRAPDNAALYEQLFGGGIRFGAPRTEIRVWKSWFDRPSPTHDQEFNSICLQHCESVQLRLVREQPLTNELRALLSLCDSQALPRLEAAAQSLKMTPRTLRRRLHEEGTSYRAQLDGIRLDRARRYLDNEQFTAKEVAYRLGFLEQSAFRTAFKSWTGMTVSQYRERHRRLSSN